jgi:hypothetical protein
LANVKHIGAPGGNATWERMALPSPQKLASHQAGLEGVAPSRPRSSMESQSKHRREQALHHLDLISPFFSKEAVAAAEDVETI